MWSGRVLLKYWLIQLAGWVVVFAVVWVLAARFGWPRWIVWAVIAAWIAKDAVLYPLTWRAYDSRGAEPSAYPREGAEGVALRRLSPTGAVRVAGEMWNAALADGARDIEDGEAVRVASRGGLTLLVEPVNDEPRR
jgi:membrane protein implicated in regulation of membrane protease activity